MTLDFRKLLKGCIALITVVDGLVVFCQGFRVIECRLTRLATVEGLLAAGVG